MSLRMSASLASKNFIFMSVHEARIELQCKPLSVIKVNVIIWLY